MIRVGIIATCAALILMAGIMVWTYVHLPPTGPIPVHFTGEGRADGWAVDRGQALRYFIFIMGALWFLSLALGVIAHLAPKGGGLERSLPVLTVIWVGAAVLLTCVMGAAGFDMVRNAGASIEPAPSMLSWVGVGVSVLIIAIGNVLPKTRPNFLLGIRTPWTLSSPSTWERTHRLGGLLIMFAGVAGVGGAFVFKDRWAILTGVAAMLAAAFIAAIYSFVVWLSANDKGQTPNYLP